MKPLSLLRLTCLTSLASLRWFKHLSMFSLVAWLSACAGVGVRADAAHNQARAHTELAARYYQVGQVAVAVQEAQIAVASDANYVPAQTLLALIYAELRQNKLADAHFERALSLSAAQGVSNTDLRNSYAWYLCQSNRAEQGLQELSAVLNDPLYGSLDKALVNASVCAARANKFDMATSYINAALDMRPNFPVAVLYRAHIELSTNRLKQARADSQLAQKLLGDTPEVLWLMTRLERTSISGVSNASERLLKNFPTSVEASWLRAQQWQWF
ncbi:MAG: lapB 3 [Burkholderiaceae bacterium]|nr:lapB 3 [Burkholderiaceae bacterium]